jgi:hypothetical protein
MRLLSLLPLALLSTDALAQSMMVTEFLSNSLGNELTDEWIELFNGTGAAVNLNGWTLSDEVADTVVLPSINVPSGGYVIITKDGPGFISQWGVGTLNTNVFTVNYGALSNGTDEIVLTNPAGVDVWHLAYDNDEDEGFATHLAPAIPGLAMWGNAAAPGVNRAGNDNGTFGLLGYESGDNTSDGFAFVAANGDEGSPLAGPYLLAPPANSASTVVISEVMYQSVNTGLNYAGDWFELYNPGGAAVSLNGWRVRDGFDTSDSWPFPNVSIPAGGKIIVTANPATFIQTWGVGVAGTTVIGNGSVPSLGAEDELELLDAAGAMVWSVAWDSPGVLGDGFGTFFTGNTFAQEDWGRIGRRRVRVDGPDDVTGSPIGYQAGNFTADPAAFAGAADRASPLAVAANVPISIQMLTSGTCPGNTTFAVSNMTRNTPWALVASPALGSFSIPGGPCAGSQVPLAGAGIRLVATFNSDANGNGSTTVNVPAIACNYYLVAVDLGACTNSGPHQP